MTFFNDRAITFAAISTQTASFARSAATGCRICLCVVRVFFPVPMSFTLTTTILFDIRRIEATFVPRMAHGLMLMAILSRCLAILMTFTTARFSISAVFLATIVCMLAAFPVAFFAKFALLFAAMVLFVVRTAKRTAICLVCRLFVISGTTASGFLGLIFAMFCLPSVDDFVQDSTVYVGLVLGTHILSESLKGFFFPNTT